MTDLNRCHFGHVLDVLNSLPAGIAQTCVTSPPYLWLRSYGTPAVNWPDVVYQPLPGLSAQLTIPAMQADLGQEETLEAFVGHIVAVFRAVRRVLRDDGTCWINFGDSFAGSWGAQGRQGNSTLGTGRSILAQRQIAAAKKRDSGTGSLARAKGLKEKDLIGVPWRVAFALQADGWYLRSDCIWAKRNPMPESVQDRPTRAHEFVFLLAKNADYFYDAVAVREPASYGDHARNGNPDRDPEQAPGQPTQNGIDRLRRSGNKQRVIAQDGERMRTNTHLGSSVPWQGTERNMRDVFHWASKPFKGSHYAVFPPDLPSLAIRAGTSEHGQCAACGSSWERIVEKSFIPQPDVRDPLALTRGENGQKPMDASNGTQGYPRGLSDVRTTGWKQTCACAAGDPVPQVVLDPFLGSGTTAQEAQRLGRRWIGCDLNPLNETLQEGRTQQQGLI